MTLFAYHGRYLRGRPRPELHANWDPLGDPAVLKGQAGARRSFAGASYGLQSMTPRTKATPADPEEGFGAASTRTLEPDNRAADQDGSPRPSFRNYRHEGAEIFTRRRNGSGRGWP